VPQAKLACSRVGDDGDGMVAQPVRLALRLLSGPAACMAAICCISMAWGIVPPCVSMVELTPWAPAVCHGPHISRGRTCRARRRLVMRIPLVGNWSDMQPTGRRLDVLWVLTGVLSPPRPESWP
jgi:hypothetical protein